MNNVGCTPWVSSVQRWVTPSGPGPSVHRIRSYRTRSHEYAFDHAHLHPADRQRRFGTQVVSKSRCPGPRAARRGCIPSMPRGSSGPPRWSRHGAHAQTRQTRIHHDRRTGAPCQATQCVYPYRPLTNAPRPLCQHCRRVGLPSGLPGGLTQSERCKARPTSRTPSAQAVDPLGTGVKNAKLDGPVGHRRTKTHPERWVSLRRARKKTYHVLLSETSFTAPLEKCVLEGVKRGECPNWEGRCADRKITLKGTPAR